MARKKLVQESQVNEEGTAAAETIKPGYRNFDDPRSRIETMSAIIGDLAKVDKTTLAAIFDQVQAQVGHEADSAPADAAAKNAASIQAGNGGSPANALGAAVREDVQEMLKGYELTEEFKEKAVTLFEAAINARVATEVARIEEELVEEATDAIAQLEEERAQKLDAYMDYVAENWMAENEVAIESTLRNELAGEFIEGLRELFAEHYIDIPSDKSDIVEALSKKVDELEAQLDEVITDNAELSQIAAAVAAGEIIEETGSERGLAMAQVEKLKELAKGIEFTEPDEFKGKVEVVLENYFPGAKKAPAKQQSLNEVENDAGDVEEVTPRMQRYMDAVSRSVAK